MGVWVFTTLDVPAIATPPAGAYDLTTLARAKLWLSLPDSDTAHDTFLAMVITQASLVAKTYCERVFAVEGLTDVLRFDAVALPERQAPLQLSRKPVVATTLNTGALAALGATVLLFSSTAGAAAGYPASAAGIPPGTTVASVVANVSVTLSAPLTAPIASGSPVTFGLAVSQLDALGADTALVLGADYLLDTDAGRLIRLDADGELARWDSRTATVAYRAGYAAAPADLEGACHELIAGRWHARGRDPMLRSRDQPGGVGRQEWWVGGPPGSGALPQSVMTVLDLYRSAAAIL